MRFDCGCEENDGEMRLCDEHAFAVPCARVYGPVWFTPIGEYDEVLTQTGPSTEPDESHIKGLTRTGSFTTWVDFRPLVSRNSPQDQKPEGPTESR